MRLVPLVAATALALVCAVAGPVAAQGPAPATTLAVRGATVVDVRTSRLLPDQTVLVTGNRITAAGADAATRVPPGAQVIDGRGKYLIPGLIDTHVHLFMPWNRNWPDTLAQFGWIVAGGVTTVREATGSAAPSYLAARRALQAGQLVGPRLVITGTPGAIQQRAGTTNLAEALGRARELGIDQIKVFAMRRERALELIRAARQAGLVVYGHTGGAVQDTLFDSYALAAVKAGISGFAHLPAPEGLQRNRYTATWETPGAERVRQDLAVNAAVWLNPDTTWQQTIIDSMVARGVWLEPTLTVKYHDNESLVGTCTAEYDRAAMHRYFPFYNGAARPELTAVQRDSVQRICRSINAFVRRFHEAGGLIIAGSDNPAFPPMGATEEMRLLVAAGLPPVAALQAATINAARALEIEREVGSIEEGKLADLVLLDGNPLDDILNTRRIAAVIADGRVVDRETLLARTGTTPMVTNWDEDLARLAEPLRELTQQRPDSVVDLIIQTNEYAGPAEWRRIEELTPLRVQRVSGGRVLARGPAGVARFLTRTRFVIRVELAAGDGGT